MNGGKPGDIEAARDVDYAYDLAGNVSRLSYPGGTRVETTFDGSNRRDVIDKDGSQIAGYDYVGPRKCGPPEARRPANLRGWEEQHRPGPPVRRGGRPYRPVLTVLKCLRPAKWLGPSGPQLEESLRDRLIFRRFVGIGLREAGHADPHRPLPRFPKR